MSTLRPAAWVVFLLLLYPLVPAVSILLGLSGEVLFQVRAWSSIIAAGACMLILAPGDGFSGVWSSSLVDRLAMIAVLGITNAQFCIVQQLMPTG